MSGHFPTAIFRGGELPQNRCWNAANMAPFSVIYNDGLIHQRLDEGLRMIVEQQHCSSIPSQTRAKHWVKVPDDEVGHEAFHGPHLQFLLQVMSLVTVCLILPGLHTQPQQVVTRGLGRTPQFCSP